MTQDTPHQAIDPDRDHPATHALVGRLGAILRGHRPDPHDPDHRCLCGYEGECYDDHLAGSTLREMKDVGYEVWPVRHG